MRDTVWPLVAQARTIERASDRSDEALVASVVDRVVRVEQAHRILEASAAVTTR